MPWSQNGFYKRFVYRELGRFSEEADFDEQAAVATVADQLPEQTFQFAARNEHGAAGRAVERLAQALVLLQRPRQVGQFAAQLSGVWRSQDLRHFLRREDLVAWSGLGVEKDVTREERNLRFANTPPIDTPPEDKRKETQHLQRAEVGSQLLLGA